MTDEDPGLEFRLLGPLEVRQAGAAVPVAPGRQRVVLAALLLSAGRVVSVDELAAALWGEDPPAAAVVTVRNYVKRLRQVLGDAGSRILTRPPGYLIIVAPAELDVTRFEDLTRAALAAARQGSWAEVSQRARAGLALWRGADPLAGVESELLARREVRRLSELRWQALELAAEASLQLGLIAEVIPELRRLAGEQPLRERLHALLMTALYRDGQQAAALAAYRSAREVMVTELGAEPGRELQDLHSRILAEDPAAEPAVPAASAVPAARAAAPRSPARGSPARGPSAAVRYSLPPDTAAFTGRDSELAAITTLAGPAAEPGGPAVVLAISGMPGAGKTALAVRAAYLLAGEFPDRQLFVDLRGQTLGEEPAAAAELLAGLLAADGVDARYLPAGRAARAAMWRSRMAGKRVLLVLDNAASGAQVEPLLPATPGSLVLVTGRRYLAGLPAAQVSLDVLPAADAEAMFVRLARRAAAAPAQVAELAALCGHLPLAISLLARLLDRHPSWSLTDLVAETRARLLTAAPENRTVAAAFEASYQDLDPARQRFFRHLGLHPGGETDTYAAAALAGLPPDQAAGLLHGLRGDRLLEELAAGRYRMHDLIRRYARGLAAAEPSAGQAVARLLDYYQRNAVIADSWLDSEGVPALAGTGSPGTGPGGREQARAWLSAERDNLLACIADAAGRGEDARVVALTAALAAYLRSDGPWPQAAALHEAAAAAARRLDDRRAEAGALLSLGTMRQLTGDYPGAADALEQSLAVARFAGDRAGEASALLRLGAVRRAAGDLPAAARLLKEALGLARAAGDRAAEASALLYLGTVWRLTGDLPAAASAAEQSLAISRGAGNRAGEATALFSLGTVRQLAGDCAAAAGLLRDALRISRAIGDRLGEANALCYLGAAAQVAGDYPDAAIVLTQSMGIYRDVGARLGEANALLYLGTVRRLTGDLAGAAALLEQSGQLAREIGSRLGEANVLLGLGAVRQAAGDYPAAADLLGQALDRYRDAGDRAGQAEALNQAGTLHLARGEPSESLARHRDALSIARAVGSQLEEARALEGAGRASADGAALREALAIYERIGSSEASRLAAELGDG